MSKHYETEINEGTLEIIAYKKYDPALQRILHQSRWYLIYFSTLLFLSCKPSFYICLAFWIVFGTVCLHSYLLIIGILRILMLIQCPYNFNLLKPERLWWDRFNVLFLHLQGQNVLIMFLFSMKHSSKITPDVNNSL